VLIDWSQNHRQKTTIGVYPLRARERPIVSTLLRWEEIQKSAESGDPGPVIYEAM